ncbi:MAG: DUF1552 domain-containing protein [Myxococcota bacterium]
MTLTRRSFLRALGAGAASLPFIGMLERSVFGNEPGRVAKRFIGVYHPHGASSPLYLNPEGDYSLTFPNCVLSPFDDPATYGRSFKDVLVPIEGLDVIAQGGHDAPKALLTGSKAENSSLDQFLAAEQGLGAQTPVTSVVLGVGRDGEGISFGVGGTPLPKIIQPEQTFDLLFADLIVGDDPEAQARLAAARLRGQSVLDFIRGDLSRLQPRLANEERIKLDQHLTSLREIEKRLEGPSVGGAQCTKPARPPFFERFRQYNRGEPNFDAITDLQIDLLAQAMACDVTRFATLWLEDLSRGGAQPAGLELPDNNHQDLAHRYDGPRPWQNNQGNPDSWLELGKLNRYHYGKCARLLQRLDQFGVLDETLVWISSDMGNPSSHSSRNVPTLLAGGAGGAFRMGRRLTLVEDCDDGTPWCNNPNLVPNNHLMVTIAQAFGIPIDSFGTDSDPDVVRGEISTLFA